MELNPKDLGFIVRALEYRIGWYEDQLRRPDLTEDEDAELTNDMCYLRQLLASFREEYRKAGGWV